MIELSNQDKRTAKDIIRKGILRRHAQWQQELRRLLDKPFEEGSNEFDRSMQITDKARKFYKKAMQMEEYYRNTMLLPGLANLYSHKLITEEDLTDLSEEVTQAIHFLLGD